MLKVIQPKDAALLVQLPGQIISPPAMMREPPSYLSPTLTHMLLHSLQAPLFTVTQLATVHLEEYERGTGYDLP